MPQQYEYKFVRLGEGIMEVKKAGKEGHPQAIHEHAAKGCGTFARPDPGARPQGGDRRVGATDADQYGYDAGCLDDINPLLLGKVPVNDGVNHPADRGASSAS